MTVKRKTTTRKKKLSAGVHIVSIKNCKGKACKRKVKVLKNGKWRFMKFKTAKKKSGKRS